MAQKKGKALEQLVSVLEMRLAKRDDVAIKSPRRLVDRVTGKLREHDVVLEVTSGHHQVLVGIECRDRSRPVTVEQVEAYSAKCQDTGINHAVIVSPSGFYKTARTKAAFLGVRCLELKETSSLEWLLAPGVASQKRKLKHINLHVLVSGEVAGREKAGRFILASGEEVSIDQIRDFLSTQLQSALTFGSGEIVVPFRFELDDLFAETPGFTEPRKVTALAGKAIFEVEESMVPFKMYEYSDQASGSTLANAAVARLEEGPVTGSLIVAHKPGEGGRVIFVPDKKGK